MPRLLRALARIGVRRIWLNIHWFVGISAGTALMLVGLTGALLSFQDEVLDLFNPGVRQVQHPNDQVMSPDRIVALVATAMGNRKIETIDISSSPAMAAKVRLYKLPGQDYNDTLYVDPASERIETLGGDAAFDSIESLHRYLLLDKATGKAATGVLALCLLGMAISGIYLRWPRRALDWKAWLHLDFALSGRAFLRGLHIVAGAWAFIFYMVFAITGSYWAFDSIRQSVDGWAGKARAATNVNASIAGYKPAPPKSRRPSLESIPLEKGWQSFQEKAGAWKTVNIRLAQRAENVLQFTWVPLDSPHERARDRILVLPESGEVVREERYAQQDPAFRLVSAVYPLHTGSYFGWIGRLVMMLASLGLVLFGVTGWMLYLNRKQKKSALRRRSD